MTAWPTKGVRWCSTCSLLNVAASELDRLTAQPSKAEDDLRAEVARLVGIVDSPDPHDFLTEARRLLATDPEFAATVEAAAALASRQHHSLTTPVLDQARLTAALALVAVKAGVS